MDKAQKKSIGDARLEIYSLPDTVQVNIGKAEIRSGAGYKGNEAVEIGYTLPPGKYIAKVYKAKIKKENFKEIAPGVKLGSPRITESKEYDPQWIEFEITETDVDNGVKSLGTVYLDKKRKLSVPKPAEVKRSKN